MKKSTLLCALVGLAMLSTVMSDAMAANGGKTVNTSAEKAKFGTTLEGDVVSVYTLTNTNGLSAKILDFGGVIYEMNVPDRNGVFANISCNYPTVAEYQTIRPYFGSLIGRYGNRIAKGKFSIDGKEYSIALTNAPNTLHGGEKGFDQKIWNASLSTDNNGAYLTLKYTSADGEEGYPGKLDVTVVYSLKNDNSLTIDYTATTDKKTVVNLTNHCFWNLGGAYSGSKPVLDTILTLNCPSYLPTDTTLIPTGEVKSVKGTPLDFLKAKPIGKDIAKITEEHFRGGFDHCLVLADKKPGEMSLCAYAVEPNSGRTMKVETTEPAVQFYSGNWLDGTTSCNGYKYEQHTAFCLETQHYPDSPNQPSFPTTLLKPGDTYRHTSVFTFGVEK